MLHGLRQPEGGLYEVRLRRDLRRRDGSGPHYVAFGVARGYAGNAGQFRPGLISISAGWLNSRGRRFGTLSEVAAMAHPSGHYTLVTATIGLTWSPAPRERR